jgi:hypothetical protein
MNTAANWIEWVGIAALFAGLAWWVKEARKPGVIIHRSQPAPRPQLTVVPERQALSPLQWAVPMYEELDWVSPQLQRHVHRMVLLLVEQHAGDMADELTRQLNAAQRVVRGEIAS